MSEQVEARLRALVGDEPFTAAGAHADPVVLARKHETLTAEHVAPFLAWRAETASRLQRLGVVPAVAHLPHVDPASGGVHAEVVVLHGDSVPCLVRERGGSGLVSQDNVEGPARRLWGLCRSAGVGRADLVEWNSVPWGPAAGVGLAEARRALAGWLDLLGRPRRVVLLGSRAARFRPVVASVLTHCEVLAAPSASQMARITFPDADERIVRALAGRG